MANFTTEELQQMLNDKIQGETTASLMEISEFIPILVTLPKREFDS